MTARLRALAVARIVLGALVVVRTTPLIAGLYNPMIEAPRTLLGWPGDGWTITAGPPLPAGLVIALCVLRTGAAFVFMLGLWPRAMGIVAGVTGLLVMAQDAFGMTHTFRLLYGSLLLLAVTDCTATWSLRAKPARDLQSSELLVRAWVTSVYAWAVIAKLRPGWWSGLALELDAADGLFPFPAAQPWLADARLRSAAAVSVLVVEVAITVCLVLRPTRRLAIVLAVLMQLAFEVVARPDVFGVAMMSLLATVWVSSGPDRSASGDGATEPVRSR